MANLDNIIQSLNDKDADFDQLCQNLAKDVISQQLSLLDVVSKLEDRLTNTDIQQREEGLRILSTIIQEIPVTTLNHDEVVQFCTFYQTRLNDNYKLIPQILTGILALARYDLPMPERCFTGMLTTMFQTVSCQAQAYQDRMKIYQVLQTMLRTQTQELLDLGPDFVYGVISAIDGERDPRNLLWLFKWLPEFIGTIKLGHLVEEMYDVMSCYFPVDFRVPAQNANGISRDALAEALKPCLCASPDFAEQTITLAMEKLDSDLQLAKMDALQLLSFGCKKFDVNIYIDARTAMWSILQKELLKCPSNDFEQLLLATITDIAKKLSPNRLVFDEVFDNILETNVGNLNGTGKMFTPTWKLFLAMSKGNRQCAEKVLHEVQPRLINLFNIIANKAHRLDVLQVLVEFIKVGDVHNANVNAIPHVLLTIVHQQHDDGDLQTVAFDSLCFIQNQLKDDENVKAMLIEAFKTFFLHSNRENVKKAFHNCILHYSVVFCTEITCLLEYFLTGATSKNEIECIMDNLSYLSGHEPFTGAFFSFLGKYFNEASRKMCLQVLRKSLQLHGDNQILQLAIHNSSIVESKLLDVANCPSDIGELQDTKDILKSIVGTYTQTEQNHFLTAHYERLISATFMSSNGPDMRLLYILSGMMTRVFPLNLRQDGVGELLRHLFQISLNSDQGNQIAVELLANIVNKMPNHIENIVQSFEIELLVKSENDLENLDKRAMVVIWLTKALYMKGHEIKLRWLNLLMEYLPKSELVALGIKTIMSDNCDSLGPSSYAQRRWLYRQQFFNDMCQKLEDTHNFIENRNYIIAFASLISEVPNVILKMNFQKLLRLIVLCLDKSDEPTGIIAILRTIKLFIETRDALSEQYMDDFIPRLLALTRFKSMNVRIIALQCVRLYVDGFMPVHKLLPHQANVIDALGLCIDDRKRLVRKEAADARLKWYLLGAPI